MSTENKESMDNLEISDVGKAEELINLYKLDDRSSPRDGERLINELLTSLLQTGKLITGDADEFHNFSVSVLKFTSDYSTALDIIKAGLEIHETDTDLLADAIKYGYNCGEKENCRTWYRRLCGIPKERWTWRAFTFSVDYLLELFGSAPGSNAISLSEIFSLVYEFQHYHPQREDGWLCEQKVYAETNQDEKGIEVLETAMERLKSCPKCWLRYADLMIERGEYDKAEPVVKKLRNDPRSDITVNGAYVYYLDGICRMRNILSSDDLENGNLDRRAVEQTYKTFYLAFNSPDIRNNIRSEIIQKVKRMEIETEIQNPYNFR